MKFCETALSVSQHKKQQETPLRERLHKCSSWYFKKCIISWWKCMIWYIHDQYISRICRLCWWENNWSYNSTYVERRNIQRVRGSKDLSKDIKKLFKFTKLSVSNNKKKIPCIEIFKLATDRGPFFKQCYRRDEILQFLAIVKKILMKIIVICAERYIKEFWSAFNAQCGSMNHAFRMKFKTSRKLKYVQFSK